MSFKIQWPTFTREFVHSAKAQLGAALNKGNKPPNIVGDIIVKELHMGSKVRLIRLSLDVFNHILSLYPPVLSLFSRICTTPDGSDLSLHLAA